MNDLAVTPLSAADAARLHRLITGDREEYRRYFTPFASQEAVQQALGSAREDCYWGIWFASELAGFFMMRGLDEGYRRPSFGVYIAEPHAGKGLSRFALEYCMSWCRMNGIEAMMLKVHPDNLYARRSYERAGFQVIGTCPRTTHTMMEKRWSDRP